GYLVERDPGCTVCVWQRVVALNATGRKREAAEELEAILEWHPASDSLYSDIGTQWLVAGDPQKALDFFTRQQFPNEDDPGRLLALHDLGRTEEFEDEFARYIERNADNPEGIARAYAWTGNNDEAFLWLERMVEMGGPQAAELLYPDMYTRLENDPRWLAFLERYQRVDPGDTGIQFQPKLPPDIRAITGDRQAGR
ncbi:MAG TPA: hypothetical protein VLB07_10605, partial [Woeseiaceae bacterium]|nr:hypothetical protein [Woeseiaceae bacterium]